MGKKLMTKETIKALGAKLKFKNKIAEAADDPLLNMFNNLVLDKVAEKLSDEVLNVVVEALETVIEEMPEVEI